MASASEIEKLERKWKETPKGTVFAPYAEALRKHGQLAQARDVLKKGLENHPDYVPGNIVLGRCCLDLGEDGAAEAAFSNALRLDPENVIALKALSDITERQGRLAEAVTWLTTLVTVDPSNDEARDQLARVEAAREQASMLISAASPEVTEPEAAPTATGAGEIADEPVEEVYEGPTVPMPSPVKRPPAPPSAPAAVGPDIEATVPMVPAYSMPAPPRPAPPPPPPPEPVPEPEPDLEVSEPVAAGDAPQLRDLEPQVPFSPPPAGSEAEVVSLSDMEAPVIELNASEASEYQVLDASSDLTGLQAGSSEYQVPDASSELSFRASGASEYQTPSGAEELLASSGVASEGSEGIDAVDSSLVELQSGAYQQPDPAIMAGLPTETFEVEPPPPTSSTPTPAPPPTSEPAPPSVDLPLIFPDQPQQAAPPVTRRISEEVRVAPPSAPTEPVEPEPILTESMAEVYATQGLHEEALDVYRQLLARSPGDARLAARVRELEAWSTAQASARRPAYMAAVTGGESVESFFRNLVEVRQDGAESSEPASSEAGGTGAPTRPASDPLSLSALFGEDAAPGAAPTGKPSGPRPAATPPAADPFSFDQFFSGKGPGEPRTPSIRGSKATATPSDEDLDQFQNWLKNLKK